jgi:hypothetical protein
LALERKETELEQWKAGNARNAIESQKSRAVSPFRLPKYGTNGNMKPENGQRSIDDRSSEVIECRIADPFVVNVCKTINIMSNRVVICILFIFFRLQVVLRVSKEGQDFPQHLWTRSPCQKCLFWLKKNQ